jgi:hypothetical protein
LIDHWPFGAAPPAPFSPCSIAIWRGSTDPASGGLGSAVTPPPPVLVLPPQPTITGIATPNARTNMHQRTNVIWLTPFLECCFPNLGAIDRLYRLIPAEQSDFGL